MAYNRTIWEDSPSTNTPITADRLNNMENGIQTAFDTVEKIKNADNVYQCVASYDATYNAFLTDISEFDIESVKSGDIFVLTINRDYEIPKPSLNMIMFRVNTNVLVGNIININTALEINENDVFYIIYSKESNIFIPLNLDVVLDYATKKSVERIESSLDCMIVPDTTLGYHRYDGCMYIDDSGSSSPYNYINPHTVDKEGYTSFKLLLKPGKSYNFKIYIDKADMDTFTAHFNKAELHPKGSTEPESIELIKKIGKNYSDSCYVYDDYITFYCSLTNCDYYGLLYISCKTDRLADSYAYYGVSTAGNDDGVGIPYALSRIGKMLWHTNFALEDLEKNKLSRADLKGYALKTDIPSGPSDIGAEPSGTTEAHNTNIGSHNDIRLLIQGLTDRLDALADCDDGTLDQLSEIVAYIKNNRELIESVTTSKVGVDDIIDNLTTNVTNKPLSAAQGVALKALIDAIVVPKKVSDLEDGSAYATKSEMNDIAKIKVDKVDGMGLSECSFTKNNENYLSSLSKQFNYTNNYNYDLGVFTAMATLTGDVYLEGGAIPVDYCKISNGLDEKINDLASNGVYKNTKMIDTFISDIKAYIGMIDDEVVGVQIDYENKTSQRLAGAVKLTAGSDFDKYAMFGGRKRCNVADDGTITAYYGDDNYVEDGSNGQVMVYQPAFYYKVVPLKIDVQTDGIGYHLRKANYYVSTKAKAGFRLHPAFYDANGNELDYILIGAYEGSIYDTSASAYLLLDEQVMAVGEDKFCSIAGVKPASGLTQNLTRPNIETMAQNRGANWHLENSKIASMEQLLCMIEMGTMNFQTAIGQGVVNISDNSSYNCASFTGSTASLGNGTGRATETINEKGGVQTTETADGKTSVSYRGVENDWGNIWKFIIDPNIWGNSAMGGGEPFYCDDFNFAENKKTDNYKGAGFTVTNAGGYISAMGYSTACDWLFMASECLGNSSVPVGDYHWVTQNLNGYKIALLGGSWAVGSSAGGFFWGLNYGVGGRARSIGGRLVYVPTATA